MSHALQAIQNVADFFPLYTKVWYLMELGMNAYISPWIKNVCVIKIYISAIMHIDHISMKQNANTPSSQ